MADSTLYTRLKRLFSSNVVVRNIGDGKELKVIDSDGIEAIGGGTSFRDRYSRMYSANQGYGTGSQLSMAYQAIRLELFRDYDLMDNDPTMSTALDIYGEESTIKNEYDDVLEINSPDEAIREVLHNLFYDIMNIEFNLHWWIRSMCKYGDFFLFLEISPEYGIHNVMPLSVYDTLRIEGEDPANPYYVRFETTGMNMPKMKLENFQVAHFRMLNDGNFLPYGKAMLEGARRSWKQLMLMEDAMMIHRIMRAPEKRKISIDIGNIPPAEVDNHMERIINSMKKVPLVDPKTGDYNLKFNMQNMTEDYYLPVRGGDSGTDIENLPGLEFNGMEDIQYLLNRVFTALKIPKSFLGFEADVNGKSTLAAEDVRFARTIEKIQRIVVSELKKIATVHLYAQGYKDEDLVNFDLSLTIPSMVYEQEKLSLLKERVETAQSLIDSKIIGTDWIYENVFKFSEDDVKKLRICAVEDAKRMFRLTSIETQGEDPAKGPVTPPGGGMQPPPGQPGRPPEGSNYGQDSHPAGRDPLGNDENQKAMQVGQERASPKKSPFAVEAYGLERMKKNPTTMLTEADYPSTKNADSLLEGTFMDENKLMTGDSLPVDNKVEDSIPRVILT